MGGSLTVTVLKAPSRQPAVCCCVVVAAAYTNRGDRPGLPDWGFKTLMVGHRGSSAGSYLADPTSPIPSHCAVIILFKEYSASIVGTSILRVLSILKFGFVHNPHLQPHILVHNGRKLVDGG